MVDVFTYIHLVDFLMVVGKYTLHGSWVLYKNESGDQGWKFLPSSSGLVSKQDMGAVLQLLRYC